MFTENDTSDLCLASWSGKLHSKSDFLAEFQADRFIPNRSAMDFDFANYMLTQSRKDKKNAAAASTSKEAYRKLLDEVLLNNRTRILAFNSKPLAPPERVSSSHQTKSARRQRHIPQVRFLLPFRLYLSNWTFNFSNLRLL